MYIYSFTISTHKERMIFECHYKKKNQHTKRCLYYYYYYKSRTKLNYRQQHNAIACGIKNAGKLCNDYIIKNSKKKKNRFLLVNSKKEKKIVHTLLFAVCVTKLNIYSEHYRRCIVAVAARLF